MELPIAVGVNGKPYVLVKVATPLLVEQATPVEQEKVVVAAE